MASQHWRARLIHASFLAFTKSINLTGWQRNPWAWPAKCLNHTPISCSYYSYFNPFHVHSILILTSPILHQQSAPTSTIEYNKIKINRTPKSVASAAMLPTSDRLAQPTKSIVQGCHNESVYKSGFEKQILLIHVLRHVVRALHTQRYSSVYFLLCS